jgi:hypothetical protein
VELLVLQRVMERKPPIPKTPKKYDRIKNGGVGERLKPAVLKTCRKKSGRVFSFAYVGTSRDNSA